MSEQCREAFEAWMKSFETEPNLERDLGEYLAWTVQRCWAAWSAAQAQPAQQEQPAANLKNWPQRIYLQHSDEGDPLPDFNDLEDVTWCKDRIDASDVEYVLAPKHAQQEQPFTDKTNWHGNAPPMDATGTLQWMRANVALPEGVQEHIDGLLAKQEQPPSDQYQADQYSAYNETQGKTVAVYPLTPSGLSKRNWFLRMIKEGNPDTFTEEVLYRKIS